VNVSLDASIYETAYAAGFPPIDGLLPQRGTMKLLDRVVSFTEQTLVAEARVDAAAWYADAAGAMPAWIGIELMAQAIAAHVALRLRIERRPAQPGVLLGARRYDVGVQSFARDGVLQVEVRETIKVDGGHGAYDCDIRAAGDTARLAGAVVKVYQPDNFQQFMQGSAHS
jgi:predicted hotdog family 3-hydroxylacyl-ACP dehydratase